MHTFSVIQAHVHAYGTLSLCPLVRLVHSWIALPHTYYLWMVLGTKKINRFTSSDHLHTKCKEMKSIMVLQQKKPNEFALFSAAIDKSKWV